MSKKIYVGNLSTDANEDELRALFFEFGTATIKITRDIKGQSQGFAFVEMVSAEAGALAISALNAKVFAGKKLEVNAAKPPASRDKRRVLANRRNRGRNKN
jgi:RNA recognition motif-containing protein